MGVGSPLSLLKKRQAVWETRIVRAKREEKMIKAKRELPLSFPRV
jgi:hypothetical protein